jgi:transposase
MLMLPPSVRIFLAAQPVDLRRSFDRLAEAARTIVKEDPFSGHLFVFRNRSGDRLKVLFWDRSGFVIWYKRLEVGHFCLPPAPEASVCVEMAAPDLALMLEGIDLAGAKRQRRFVFNSVQIR